MWTRCYRQGHPVAQLRECQWSTDRPSQRSRSSWRMSKRPEHKSVLLQEWSSPNMTRKPRRPRIPRKKSSKCSTTMKRNSSWMTTRKSSSSSIMTWKRIPLLRPCGRMPLPDCKGKFKTKWKKKCWLTSNDTRLWMRGNSSKISKKSEEPEQESTQKLVVMTSESVTLMPPGSHQTQTIELTYKINHISKMDAP